MAIHRSQNFLSQQRLEASNLKSMESAVSFDFDALVGLGLTRGEPLVLKGLVLNSTGAINQLATSLTIAMASSVVWNYAASEAGSVFTLSSSEPDQQLTTTNANVIGSFLNGTNFVGIDFFKTPDASTSDTAKFIDSDSNKEYGQVVPLARTLKYKIYISTQPFSATLNVVPIAKIVVSNGIVTSITDARPMLFRLGTGGDAPSATASYAWGSRTENPVSITLNTSPSPFNGEDKSINNLKDWVDSTMTSLWELRGGTSWYSNVYRDHVKLTYGQPVMKNGDNMWFLNGEQVFAGDLDKTASSIVTLTYTNHPFTVGSRFRIQIDAGDTANFAAGTYTVLTVPTANAITYDDGITATASSAGDAFINDTIAFAGMALLFENSGSASIYKDTIQSGSMVIEDKYCVFVDLDRSVNATLTPQVRPLYSLSSPTLPGRRHIIAWRDGNYVYGKDKNYEAGRTFIAATTLALGLVKLNQTAESPTAPVVVSIMTDGRIQVTATGANTNAATFTGTGTGVGVLGQAGASVGSAGVKGLAGAGITSYGVWGLGNGSLGGIGVIGEGGAGAASQGVAGRATAVSGIGVAGTASGSADYGVAGSGPIGVYGFGTSVGVKGEGSGSGDIGGEFIGGSNGNGIEATGVGSGSAGVFTAGATGGGVEVEASGAGTSAGFFEHSGAGQAVLGYAPAAGGVAIWAEGDIAIRVEDGPVRLKNVTDTPITYATVPTYTSFASAHDSWRDTAGTPSWVYGSSGAPRFQGGYLLSNGSSAVDPTTLSFRVRLPKKAIIQSVQVYVYQASGSGQTMKTSAYFMQSAATRIVTYLNAGGSTGDNTASVPNATETLVTCPIIGATAIGDDQDLYVGVGRNTTTNTVEIGGVLVTYTLPTLTGVFS